MRRQNEDSMGRHLWKYLERLVPAVMNRPLHGQTNVLNVALEMKDTETQNNLQEEEAVALRYQNRYSN